MKDKMSESEGPNVFSILLGRHTYGMTPEYETAWCRISLLLGFALGLLI
jgi:hypothetical protein